MSKQSRWGQGWATTNYTITPVPVKRIMRDELQLSLHQILAIEVLVSFREELEPLSWATLETIADRSGMQNSQVAGRAIRELLKMGWIKEYSPPLRGRARVYDLSPVLTKLEEIRVRELQQANFV